MPFLPPNQQHQSTEGTLALTIVCQNSIPLNLCHQSKQNLLIDCLQAADIRFQMILASGIGNGIAQSGP